MSNFLYMSDTHVGSKGGYHQQTPYYLKIEEIIEALDNYLQKHKDIKFILHGGDIIDKTSEGNIKQALHLFKKLPIPTYLCLGNHDLTEKESTNIWLNTAPYFFKNNKCNYSIIEDDYVIHVMPCNWCDKPLYWDKTQQDANFTKKQLKEIDNNIKKHKNKIQILLTHNPVFGIPPEQTSLEEPVHAPEKKFQHSIFEIIKDNPSIKIVLGAHNHMNMNKKHSNINFITSSALNETPFEFKHFQIDKNHIKMETVSLQEEIKFNFLYDFNKTYVQGRLSDRTLSINL